VVACEVVAIAWIRRRFSRSAFRTSLVHVCVGGAAIVAGGVVIGGAA
jgi:hypothetical protein